MYVLAHTWRLMSTDMKIFTFTHLLGNLKSKQSLEETGSKLLLNFRKEQVPMHTIKN